MRTHSAGYVGGEEHWCIYWQDARLLLGQISLVLRALADILEQERRKKHQPQPRPMPSIQFIREEEKPSSSKKIKKSLLKTAPAWEIRVDLGRKLHFPQVVQTSLRPDMVIWSEEAKKIILGTNRPMGRWMQ